MSAQGTEMATDGALGGGIDSAFRAGIEGEDISDAFISGLAGGAILSPIIGGGFKAAGKVGNKVVQSVNKKHLLDKLKNANTRKEFAALRDEIKKLPNGDNKTKLIQEYQKCYNEWKTQPDRADIRMEYKKTNLARDDAINLCKECNYDATSENIESITKLFTDYPQLKENFKSYIPLINAVKIDNESIYGTADLIFNKLQIKPEEINDYLELSDCLKHISRRTEDNYILKSTDIFDFYVLKDDNTSVKSFVDTFKKLRTADDQRVLDIGVIDYIANNGVELTENRVKQVAEVIKGIEKDSFLIRGVIGKMLTESDEKLNHYGWLLNYIDKNIKTDLSILPKTKAILEKIFFNIDDDYIPYFDEKVELYQRLVHNTEIIEALKNGEIEITENFIKRPAKIVSEEIINPDNIDEFDPIAMAAIIKQQKQMIANELKELSSIDILIEGLLSTSVSNSPLKILATKRKSEIFNFFDKVDELKQRAIQRPDLYLNGENLTPEYVKMVANDFFDGFTKGLWDVFDIYDKEAVDLLMRKRLNDFFSYTQNVTYFDDETKSLLKKMVNCCNVNDKPLMPTQKIELIDLILAYQNCGLTLTKMENMAATGKLDIAELHLDLFKKIMRQNGFSKEEIESMPVEKLLAWDIKYIHLLAKEINSEKDDAYKAILYAGNFAPDFKKYIMDTSHIYGRTNAKTKAIYEENGLNFNKWLNPSKEHEIRFITKDENEERLSQIAEQVLEDINTLRSTPVKGFLDKQFAYCIKKGEFVIPENVRNNKAKLNEFTNNLIKQLDSVWKRAQGNSTSSDPNRAKMAKNTLTILDHFKQRLDDISKVSDIKISKTLDWTIKMWDRVPQKDIFQGNYSTCCIGMGNGNGSAMPYYLLDSAYNMIELVDNKSGSIVGNALCYFIKKRDGSPAFIIDNIEIDNSVKPSSAIGTDLKDKIGEYASKISKDITGREDTPVYMSNSYNDVPVPPENTRTSDFITFLGEVDGDEIYMDLYKGWVDTDNLTRGCNLFKIN